MGKQRLQFDITEETIKRIDELCEITNVPTRTEVFRNALRLYSWLVSETTPESTIKVFNEQGDIISSFKARLIYEP